MEKERKKKGRGGEGDLLLNNPNIPNIRLKLLTKGKRRGGGEMQLPLGAKLTAQYKEP